jgi:hypothetical protein
VLVAHAARELLRELAIERAPVSAIARSTTTRITLSRPDAERAIAFCIAMIAISLGTGIVETSTLSLSLVSEAVTGFGISLPEIHRTPASRRRASASRASPTRVDPREAFVSPYLTICFNAVSGAAKADPRVRSPQRYEHFF